VGCSARQRGLVGLLGWVTVLLLDRTAVMDLIGMGPRSNGCGYLSHPNELYTLQARAAGGGELELERYRNGRRNSVYS
jgi:hypothetical protein